MRNAVAQRARHWIGGTLVAFAGVAVSRWIAPAYHDPAKTWIAVTGELGALAGLGIIALGVRQRIRASRGADEGQT